MQRHDANGRPAVAPMSPRLVASLDAASARERVLVVAGLVVVALALFYGLAWPALTRDIARMQQDLARDRATLSYLKAQQRPVRRDAAASPAVAGGTGAARATGAPGSLTGTAGNAAAQWQAAIERVLAGHGLAGGSTQVAARDASVSVTLAAAPFDPLVVALGAIARDTGLRVVEARMAARVEPGTVRAELVLAR